MSDIRLPAVAGRFYPAEPARLAREVDDLLRAAVAAEEPVPKVLLAPHAGYVYSGPVAASAYARIKSAAARVKRVVLFGPAHRVPVRGLALPETAAFATPLGAVAVEQEALRAIAGLPQVSVSAAAHAWEHALEVQLPFLQRVLTDFSIVPLAVGEASPDEVAQVLECLWGGAETLIVISSDLSHYLPYSIARQTDQSTAAQILALEPKPLSHEQACGATPLNGLLQIARARGLRAQLLDLRNSGDTAGPRDQVVGYSAFAFYEGDGRVQ
ncbi:MAG: AmmeMemoRadiSam system protein B [Gammaproteobacteria bacterium]|nr:MAG: AmmeMemoRadiSam system protein B [Gammaproteobacteria bacterium]